MKTLNQILILALIVMLSACGKDESMMDINDSQSGLSGSITRFATYGDFLYALDQNKVLTFYIADTESPQLVNSLQTDYGLETIIIYDGTIFLGSRNALYILDITNPAHPFILSKSERDDLNLNAGCDPVVVQGDYAYATIKIIENVCGQVSMNSQLLVYNIADKSNPVVLKTIDMDIPNGLGYKGNFLFVCDEGIDEIVIFDIQSPENTTKYGSISIENPIDIIIREDRMIVSTKNDFVIYDISDIDNIKKVAFIPLT